MNLVMRSSFLWAMPSRAPCLFMQSVMFVSSVSLCLEHKQKQYTMGLASKLFALLHLHRRQKCQITLRLCHFE